jgi:anti-sigma factor RsiW
MEPDERREDSKSRCKEIFSLLSAYLDLELPPETCQEMEAHIAGCAPCVEFTDSLRKTVELCRQYKPEELPEPLSHDAREQLLTAYRKMMSARGSPGN